MRKIIKMWTSTPEGMTEFEFKVSLQRIAKMTKSEVIRFADTGFALIGDDAAEKSVERAFEAIRATKPQ